MHQAIIDQSTRTLNTIAQERRDFNRTHFENVRAPGARLRHVSLAGVDLSGCNLMKSHLSEVDLTGVVARLTDWKLTRFERCTLHGVDFRRSNLHRTHFEGSTLEKADLQGANMSRANLVGVRLSGSRLDDADLRRAELRGAVLAQCTFKGAMLHGADLRETDLDRAELQGAFYDENTLFPDGFDPGQNGLEAPPRVLAGRDMRNADLAGADLHEVDLSRANLSGANLSRAMLMRVDLRGAILDRAKLDGANVRFAQLDGASLRGASLKGADLRWASVADTDFSETALQGADMQCGGLETALLRGAQHSPTTSWPPGFDAERAVHAPEEERDVAPRVTERAPDTRPDSVPSSELPLLEQLDLDQLHPLLRELPKTGLGELWIDLVTALPMELSHLLLDDQYLGSLSVSENALALIDSQEQVVARIAWGTPFRVGLGVWPLSDELVEVTVALSQRVDPVTVSKIEFRVALAQRVVCARVPLEQSSEPYVERDDFRLVWPVIMVQYNMHTQGLRGLLAPPESW